LLFVFAMMFMATMRTVSVHWGLGCQRLSPRCERSAKNMQLGLTMAMTINKSSSLSFFTEPLRRICDALRGQLEAQRRRTMNGQESDQQSHGDNQPSQSIPGP
jgi:hypothetical protein